MGVILSPLLIENDKHNETTKETSGKVYSAARAKSNPASSLRTFWS